MKTSAAIHTFLLLLPITSVVAQEVTETDEATTFQFVRSRGCQTADETQECQFPFFYNGKLYDECSEDFSNDDVDGSTRNASLSCSVRNGNNFETLEWKTCSPSCLGESCPTILDGLRGGPEKPCLFPFTYLGHIYNWCTMDDHHESWCATTINQPDIEWAPCSPQCPGYESKMPTCQTTNGHWCTFPFIYNGKLYTKCTLDDHTRPWCATSVDNNGVVINSQNCSQACQGYEKADSQCRTLDGWQCHFPFHYKGRLFNGCTSLDHDQPWCAKERFPYGTVKTWANCRNYSCPQDEHGVVQQKHVQAKNTTTWTPQSKRLYYVLTALFILSLLFNLIFVGLWVYRKNLIPEKYLLNLSRLFKRRSQQDAEELVENI